MTHVVGTMIQNPPKLWTVQTIRRYLYLPRDNQVPQLVSHFRTDPLQYKGKFVTCGSTKAGLP